MTQPRRQKEITVKPYEVEALVDFLKVHALGTLNTVCARQIAARDVLPLGSRQPDRKLRAIARQANIEGHPVVSCNDGYFYAESFEDFEEMLSRYRSQRNKTHERILAIDRLRAKMFGPPSKTRQFWSES